MKQYVEQNLGFGIGNFRFGEAGQLVDLDIAPSQDPPAAVPRREFRVIASQLALDQKGAGRGHSAESADALAFAALARIRLTFVIFFAADWQNFHFPKHDVM